MSKRVTIATGQFAPALNQPEENAQIAVNLASETAQMGAEFILFPEMVITGHGEGGQDVRPTAISLDHPAIGIIRDGAREHDIAISAGICEQIEDCYGINQIVARPDGSMPFQRKGCTPGDDDWIKDDDRDLIELDGFDMCLMICADSNHDHLWRRVEDLSPDLVCHPSAGYDWWVGEGEQADVEELKALHAKMFGSIQAAQSKACELECAYAVSNPVGPSASVYWPGNSGIADRDGSVVGWLPGEVMVERMRPGYVVGNITVG